MRRVGEDLKVAVVDIVLRWVGSEYCYSVVAEEVVAAGFQCSRAACLVLSHSDNSSQGFTQVQDDPTLKILRG